MTTMLPGKTVSKAGYIIRAVIAIVLIGAFALWMVGRSTGLTNSDPVVSAQIPVEAGLISAGAPVRYHGVKVGEISAIDAGQGSSRVEMTIDKSSINAIPRSVMVRVLPRTFFGDIYIQLAEPTTDDAQKNTAQKNTAGDSPRLAGGAQLAVDAGPDAINLYNIYTKLTGLIDAVEPQKITVALAAVNKAIGGRGADLGLMIDQWSASSQMLEKQVNEFIDATPQFRRVAESLRRATPAVTATLASVTNLSRGILEHQESIAATLVAASGYLGSVGPFVASQRKNLITIIDSTGKILSTIADNPSGISKTLREADKCAQSGAIVFAGGRFNITAVPSFSQPMPYTAADCPTYQSLRGAQCTGTGSVLGRGPVRAPGAGNGTILNPTTSNGDDSGNAGNNGAGSAQPAAFSS